MSRLASLSADIEIQHSRDTSVTDLEHSSPSRSNSVTDESEFGRK